MALPTAWNPLRRVGASRITATRGVAGSPSTIPASEARAAGDGTRLVPSISTARRGKTSVCRAGDGGAARATSSAFAARGDTTGDTTAACRSWGRRSTSLASDARKTGDGTPSLPPTSIARTGETAVRLAGAGGETHAASLAFVARGDTTAACGARGRGSTSKVSQACKAGDATHASARGDTTAGACRAWGRDSTSRASDACKAADATCFIAPTSTARRGKIAVRWSGDGGATRASSSAFAARGDTTSASSGGRGHDACDLVGLFTGI